jgi:hypothetical protein
MRISMVATLRLSARRALAPTGLEPVASSQSARRAASREAHHLNIFAKLGAIRIRPLT